MSRELLIVCPLPPLPQGEAKETFPMLQKLGETLALRTADNEFFQLLRKVLNTPLQGSLLSASTRRHDGPCDGGPDIGERRTYMEVEGALGFPFSLPSQKSKIQAESPLETGGYWEKGGLGSHFLAACLLSCRHVGSR